MSAEDSVLNGRNRGYLLQISERPAYSDNHEFEGLGNGLQRQPQADALL